MAMEGVWWRGSAFVFAFCFQPFAFRWKRFDLKCRISPPPLPSKMKKTVYKPLAPSGDIYARVMTSRDHTLYSNRHHRLL